MLLSNSSLKEDAYIGEELLGPESELEHKCLVARMTIQDNDFSLVEALELYGISEEDYGKFIAKDAYQHIQTALTGVTATVKVALTVDVMAKMLRTMFGNINTKSSPVVQQLETLSKEIKEEKVSARRS